MHCHQVSALLIVSCQSRPSTSIQKLRFLLASIAMGLAGYLGFCLFTLLLINFWLILIGVKLSSKLLGSCKGKHWRKCCILICANLTSNATFGRMMALHKRLKFDIREDASDLNDGIVYRQPQKMTWKTRSLFALAFALRFLSVGGLLLIHSRVSVSIREPVCQPPLEGSREASNKDHIVDGPILHCGKT
jgi:hypothetical protein